MIATHVALRRGTRAILPSALTSGQAAPPRSQACLYSALAVVIAGTVGAAGTGYYFQVLHGRVSKLEEATRNGTAVRSVMVPAPASGSQGEQFSHDGASWRSVGVHRVTVPYALPSTIGRDPAADHRTVDALQPLPKEPPVAQDVREPPPVPAPLTMHHDMSDLQRAVSDLRQDISDTRRDVSDMRRDISDMRRGMSDMRRGIASLNDTLTGKRAKIAATASVVHLGLQSSTTAMDCNGVLLDRHTLLTAAHCLKHHRDNASAGRWRPDVVPLAKIRRFGRTAAPLEVTMSSVTKFDGGVVLVRFGGNGIETFGDSVQRGVAGVDWRYFGATMTREIDPVTRKDVWSCLCNVIECNEDLLFQGTGHSGSGLFGAGGDLQYLLLRRDGSIG